jgi:hypothetical protein
MWRGYEKQSSHLGSGAPGLMPRMIHPDGRRVNIETEFQAPHADPPYAEPRTRAALRSAVTANGRRPVPEGPDWSRVPVATLEHCGARLRILAKRIANHQPRRVMRMTALAELVLAFSVVLSVFAQAQNSPAQQAEIWRFDSLSALGGHPTKVLGHPQIIQTPYGKAVQFNGVDDALFVDVHPLAGAQTWTWEVIFRPDEGGAAAQRFFHLSVLDPATGTDANDRMLFELRIVNGQWCLDSFAMTQGHSKVLLNCQKLHALGKWYRITAVYDGKTLSNYIDNELQGEGEVQLAPQGPGHASIGVRINLKDYFKGAVYEARFTRKALPVDEFLQMPPATQ